MVQRNEKRGIMRRKLCGLVAIACILGAPARAAEPGITDTTLKLGQTMP